MSNVDGTLNAFSERELEILHLLDDGLSDREIADKLILALSTVKWHNQQIYSKLGVSKRTLAIARAKQIGLLNGKADRPAIKRLEHNLPAQPTHFVGRRREIADVKRLLQTVRLLTLTGSPGTGKTRLAIQVASEVLFEFVDGIYFVPLAPLTDAGFLINAIASVLGLENLGSQPLIETLKLDLRSKHTLLLLDNFEHMLPNAMLISELLSAAPNLKVLVTSREVLHLYGEQEYFVPTLSLPEPETHTEFTQYEAVELFVQQARTVQPDFKLTEENALDVAKICIRLDGLPLAIELVAARIKLFSPHDLLMRMGNVLDNFASSRRDIADRHLTLSRTLDWSYELLDDAEKRLFAHLGVFAAGWTLEAAEYIFGDEQNIDVLEGLASLVDKSLVRQENIGRDYPRFNMLRIIREYVSQKLNDSGSAEALRQRHAEYYVKFARRIFYYLYDKNLGGWLNLLECEHDNFRAVLKWSFDGDPEPGLQLIHVLGMCWRIRGHLVEGYEWAQKLLEKGKDAAPVVRSKALSSTSCLLACQLGNYTEAEHMGVEALALARESGDSHALASAWFALGNAGMAHDLPAATKNLEAALELFREVDDQWGSARALNCLGEITRVQENYGKAAAFYQESLKLFRQIGNPWGENIVLQNLAYIAQNAGDFDQAKAMFTDGLMTSIGLNDKCSIANNLIGLAGTIGNLGEPERAAQLFGAAEALRQMIDVHIQPGDLPDYERNLAAIQAQLDDVTFKSAWEEGRTMSLEQSIEAALNEPSLVR